MDAEDDLDDLIGVVCAGDVLSGTHILDLAQPLVTTAARPQPGDRNLNEKRGTHLKAAARQFNHFCQSLYIDRGLLSAN